MLRLPQSPLTQILASILLFLLLAPFTTAQNGAAEISGHVQDPSGAPVAKTHLAVRNVDTGISRDVSANDDGNYVVPALEPGSYEVLVDHAGFRTVQRSGITLHVNDSVRLDFSLEIGMVSQKVDVVESAPLLRSTDASLGEVVDNRKVVSLPLNGRSSFRLADLTPGFIATPASYGQFGDIPVNTTWDSNFSINGGQGYSNEIMIDGTPSTAGFFDQITTMPSVDALTEFKVQSGPMSAQFGRLSGGLLNVTTKSGTNQFHGSLYEFWRNNVLGANDYFNNLAGRPNPPFRMNQFGGAVGGPVDLPHLYHGANHTFFFFNYEGTRWRRGAVFTTTVPTAQERLGDFSNDLTTSGALVKIYDPTTTQANPNQTGAYTRQQFQGNVIPVSRLNPVAAKIASYYPLPNLIGTPVPGLNNYVSNAGTAVNKDQYTFRVDHQINDLQKIFGRGSFDNTDLCQPNYFGNVATPAPGTVGCTPFRSRSATLAYLNTLSSSAVLSVNLGYARWDQVRAGVSYGFDQSALGFPASLVSQEQIPSFPSVNMTGYSGLGNQTQLYLNNGNDTYSLLPTLNLIKGRHAITTGLDFRMNRINLFNPNAPAGNYSFSQAATQGPNPTVSAATSGDSFASLLLGVPASGSLTYDAGVSLQNFYFAGFVQDDIHVNNRLTVNIGLRYEVESPYTERRNQLVSFAPSVASPAANPSFPALTGALAFASPSNREVYSWDTNNFGPRIGFAYQLPSKTVIRSGASLFYSPLQISNSAVGFSPSSGFSSTTPMVTSLNGGLTPFNLLNNPFPSGVVPPTGSSLGAGTFLGQGLAVWNGHPKTPQSYQWNFDVQQQLPGAILIDVAYVGNRGVHLAGQNELNTLPTADLAQGSALLNSVPNPFLGRITNGALAQKTVTAESLLTPYPQFTAVNVVNDTYGESTYNALQLKVNKRFTNGLGFLFSYTFSKWITNVPWAATAIGGNNGSGTVQDWNNLRAEFALSPQNMTNSIALSWNYDLPFGKGRLFAGNWQGPKQWILGGWTLNGLTRLSSGPPLALSTSVNNTYSLGGGSRPNTNGQNATLANPNIYQWFNIGAFSAPAPFTFGNVSRTINVFAPGIANWDVSLFKDLQFREKANLQFRAEFFNVFNRANFGPPDTTLGDKTFGQITASQLLPRVGQLALKLTF